MERKWAIPGGTDVSRVVAGVAMAGGMVAGGAVVSAGPAAAQAGVCESGEFCAMDNINWGGTYVVEAWKLDGSDKHSHPRDSASSSKNRTTSRFCGVNQGLWDSVEIEHAAGTNTSWYADKNDIIDWYYDRAGAC